MRVWSKELATAIRKKNKEEAPAFIQELFKVEGVKGIYHVADFLAIDRYPKFDWKIILPEVRKVFGATDESEGGQAQEDKDAYGEVKVQLQMFKGIPMQIKLTDGEQERREGLPDRFANAVAKPSCRRIMSSWSENG